MNRFINELKRRNVVRVGAAYAVVAWLVIQVVVAVFPVLGVPDWATTMVVVIAILGFPISIIITWIYEWTPEGLMTTEAADGAGYTGPAIFGRQVDFIIIALLVVAVGWLVYERATPNEAPDASIAVLPFVNMSADPEQEYFSDGISEEVLNVLAKIPGLHVTSRSSAFQFKGDDIHIPTVATQLGVAHVLEGSVRKSGDRVRITAQLIDARADKHLWSDTYDRELDDIFAIQDEISEAIVGALVERLDLAVEVVPQVLEAASTEAYDAYLLGTYKLSQRGAANLSEAATHFEQALAIDPDYAPAHARLSIAYLELQGSDTQTYLEKNLVPKSLFHAEKSLELSPELPEGLAAMGHYLVKTAKPLEAEPYLRRAIDLNPSYVSVYVWLGRVYAQFLRFEDQLEIQKRAVRADPMSTNALGSLAGSYIGRGLPEKARPLVTRLQSMNPLVYHVYARFLAHSEGRFADATLHALESLAIDSNYISARSSLSRYLSNGFQLYREDIRIGFMPVNSLLGLGQADEAMAMALASLEKSPNSPGALAFAGNIFWVAGKPVEARQYLEKAWRNIPDGPAKGFRMGRGGTNTLLASRLDAGDEAGARLLTDESWTITNRVAEAGYDTNILHWQTALMYLNEGRDEEGMRSLEKAFERHIVPDITELHHLTRYSHLDFGPMLAEFRARMDIERDKFLTIVCNGGNPAPEAWTPMPKTCEGYVN